VCEKVKRMGEEVVKENGKVKINELLNNQKTIEKEWK